MAWSALFLVLLAAALHATWNVAAKGSGGDARFALLATLAVVVLWAPLGAWFTWRDAAGFGRLQWTLLVASGAIHVAYFVTLLRGYRFADLSVVYPVARGTGPLLSAAAATLFLDERLGPHGWVGVLAIVVGVGLIAGFRLPTGAERDRVQRGVLYGLLTGVFIAGYTVVDGFAVKRAGISPVVVDYLGNAFRLPFFVLLIAAGGATDGARLMEVARRSWRSALCIAVLGPLAYVMVLFAATMAPLSHVAPAREVSMLFATLLGGTLLDERDVGRRLLGAGLLVAGVIGLATAG